jgi:hypothetical protein
MMTCRKTQELYQISGVHISFQHSMLGKKVLCQMLLILTNVNSVMNMYKLYFCRSNVSRRLKNGP